MIIARRALLLGATAALTGCDRLARNETVRNALFQPRISTNGHSAA